MASIGRWMWRHKRAIALGTAGAAGAYVAYKVWRKKRELEELLESLGLDGLLSGEGDGGGGTASREARVREHFAATQREADRLLLDDVLPRIEQQLAGLLDTDAYKQQMKAEGRMKDPAAWNELMVLTVARSLATQYALALIVLHLRIKLNIVSRHYLLEVAETERGEERLNRLSDLTKRRFLSMEHLLSDGLQPLVLAVVDVVRAQLPAVTSLQRLTEKLTSEQALDLLMPARSALEESLRRSAGAGGVDDGQSGAVAAANGTPLARGGSNGTACANGHSSEHPKSTQSSGGQSSGQRSGGSCGNMLGTYLLNELQSHGAVAQGDQLHDLLGEVSEVLRSPAFTLTLCDLLHAAFDTLSTELAVAIQRESGAPDSDPAGGRLPLAKLFAQLHRCSQSTLSQPSAFTEALLVTPALEELCWMAYSGEVGEAR